MDFLILLGLIGLAAVLAATEISFFSVNETRLRALSAEGVKRATMALHIKSNPQRLLLTLSFSEELVRVGAVLVAASLTLRLFHSEVVTMAEIQTATGVVLALTLMIFGGVVPKTWGGKHSVPLVLVTAYPVYWLEILMTPVLLGIEPFVDKLTGGKGMAMPFVTEEELKIMLDAGGKSGEIETEEVKMIKNVFQLKDITAEDAMTPRIYVFALDGALTLEEVRERLFTSKYSRIPVFEGKSLDNICGILHKDRALMELAQGHDQVQLKDIAHPALFVPAAKPADDLMKQFRQEKRHMAIVVNEFGGMMGIVTLEDLIEEVIGEIMDETDITEELIKRIGKNQILVHGRTDVRRINEFFKAELDEEEPMTISGLIQEKLGRIPAPGEELRIGPCRLVIHEADARSIKSVQIFKEEKTGVAAETAVPERRERPRNQPVS